MLFITQTNKCTTYIYITTSTCFNLPHHLQGVYTLTLPEDDAVTLKHVGVLNIISNIVDMYIVHLLVWLINCIRCVVHITK